MSVPIYLLIGIASILVVEGAVYVLVPGPMKRLVIAVTVIETGKLRTAGLIAFVAGVAVFVLLARFGPL